MMIARKFLIPIIIITMLPLLTPNAQAAEPFVGLVAKTALLAEVDTGAVLFDYNMNAQYPVDSLAKVMTLIIALAAVENDEASIDEIVVMTESARTGISPPTSNALRITAGEEMTLLELMYCAFIGGVNEACNLIAEHIAGSIEAFVEMMNEQAVLLGCMNTNFTNAHGQYNANQYTTASDMFLIYREALCYSYFEDISGTYRYTVSETNKAVQRRLTATNSLLNIGGKYFYRPCTSGLASITYEGGHSFAGFAESDGLSLIVIIFGSDVIMFPDQSAEMRNLTEAARLFAWGFASYSWRTILSQSDLVARAPLKSGAGADYINLRPESEIILLLDNDISEKDFTLRVVLYNDETENPLIAPVEADAALGEVTVTRYDPVTGRTVSYGTIRLLANTGVEMNRLEYIRIQVADVLSGSIARGIIWSLFILVALYAALVIRYNIVRLRRIRRVREAKRKLIEERRQEESGWD